MNGSSRFFAAGLLFARLTCALLFARAAHAADPIVVTHERGGWTDALDGLRRDLDSEGRALHLSVHAGGARLACGHYRLVLNQVARTAFRIAACDEATDETALVLEHRTGLFDHHSRVPRPRPVSISAVVIDEDPPPRCVWPVHPYLDDPEHGTRVPLTPAHYTLRSWAPSVTATPDGTGWALTATAKVTSTLDYEVLEDATGEVVLRQSLAATCPQAAPPPPAPPVKRDATPEASWLTPAQRSLREDANDGYPCSTSGRKHSTILHWCPAQPFMFGMVADVGLGLGYGFTFQWRPTARYALRLDTEGLVMFSTGSGGGAGSIPLAWLHMLYLNPRDFAAAYLVAGPAAGWKFEMSQRSQPDPPPNHAFVAALAGLGIDLDHIGWTTEVRAILLTRDFGSQPEYRSSDGRTSNLGVGVTVDVGGPLSRW